MGELIIVSGIGLSLIGMGFLVVKYPMLISGYNTMNKEQRAKIDIRSYSIFMRNVMVCMGLASIIGSLCLYLAGWSEWKDEFMIIIIFTGCGILVWKGNQITKHIKKSKAQKWIGRIAIGFALILILCLADTGRAAKIEVKDNLFIIHSAYGVEIPLDSITDVEIVNQLPAITMRTNGLSFWKYHKGHYNSEEGRVMLFFHSGQGPFLRVKSTIKPPIFINRSTPEEIENLYLQLRKE